MRRKNDLQRRELPWIISTVIMHNQSPFLRRQYLLVLSGSSSYISTASKSLVLRQFKSNFVQAYKNGWEILGEDTRDPA